MNQRKLLASFLGATMICSQTQGFIPNVSARPMVSQENSQKKGLSTAAKIALGIGVPAAAAVIIGGSIFLAKYLGQSGEESTGSAPSEDESNNSSPDQGKNGATVSTPKPNPNPNSNNPQGFQNVGSDGRISAAQQNTDQNGRIPAAWHNADVPGVGSQTQEQQKKKIQTNGASDGDLSSHSNQPKVNTKDFVDEPKKSTIGDAMDKYQKENPGKATKLEDFSVYRGTTGDGTPLGNFLNALFWGQRLAHPSKKEQTSGHIIGAQPLGNFRNGLLNVDGQEQGSKGPKTSKLEDLNNDQGISELNQRIFVQVGKTPQENISYLELHRLLWEDVQGLPDLHDFWGKHKDHIDKRFMDLLHKYGYNPETAPVSSSVPGSVDVPPPYVPTSPMITKHSAAFAGSKDLFKDILPPNIYVRGFHHLTDAEINTPTEYMVKDEQKGKVYGGFDKPYRETTLDNGQCATNQTGYSHGIANIFACFADRLNRRMVLAYDELRDQEFYTVSDTIPDQPAVSGRTGSIEHKDCANMATALLSLQKKGCKNISCNSAPNPSDPSGSPAGALTLEETISGESTYFVTVGSGVAKPYYQIFAKNKVFDPRALGIARNITFYTPDLLSDGYMLRQGLKPSTLDMDPKDVYENHTIKNVTVLLSAAPKTGCISETDFRAMNLQQINALRAMGCDGVVIVEGGAGSFGSIPSKYYQPGGMIEKIWREKAPDMHVVIMHTPRDQFSRGLDSAYGYLDESEKAVKSSKLTPERQKALLATIERARRDVTLDADLLKKAISDEVFQKKKIPDFVTLENGKVEIDTTAITRHVTAGSKNIAACYYGKTAIHNFIEDVLASKVIEGRSEETLAKKLEAAHGENNTIMSTLLWRNSNNTIWYVTGKKAGFRFSEPTYTGMKPVGGCVLKRFVEYNGKMYEAELHYTDPKHEKKNWKELTFVRLKDEKGNMVIDIFHKLKDPNNYWWRTDGEKSWKDEKMYYHDESCLAGTSTYRVWTTCENDF